MHYLNKISGMVIDLFGAGMILCMAGVWVAAKGWKRAADVLCMQWHSWLGRG